MGKIPKKPVKAKQRTSTQILESIDANIIKLVDLFQGPSAIAGKQIEDYNNKLRQEAVNKEIIDLGKAKYQDILKKAEAVKDKPVKNIKDGK